MPCSGIDLESEEKRRKRKEKCEINNKLDIVMANDFFYRKVIAYQLSMKLVDKVYEAVDSFPAYELHVLADQLRRAAISVPSNIAEGTGRFSYKERILFMEIAYGSLMETMCQLEIAHDRHYIPDFQFQEIESLIQETSRTLFGFRNSLIEKNNRKTDNS